jgi:hypothetical protein
MKKEVNPVVTLVVAVVMVAAVVGGLLYFSGPRAPGGVQYTPGVPPWQEKGAAPYKATPDYPQSGSNLAPGGGTAASGSGTPGAPPMTPPAVGGK